MNRSRPTQHAKDIQQVEPLLGRTESHLQVAEIGDRPREFLATRATSATTTPSVFGCTGMVPDIATQRLKHHEELPPVPRGRIPKSLTPKQRVSRTLRTKKERETYRKRKGQVEPIFGQIKQAGGFRQFAKRRLDKMKAEWQLVCLTHNLLQLW